VGGTFSREFRGAMTAAMDYGQLSLLPLLPLLLHRSVPVGWLSMTDLLLYLRFASTINSFTNSSFTAGFIALDYRSMAAIYTSLCRRLRSLPQ